jgi:nicotinamide mononucleotide transporter
MSPIEAIASLLGLANVILILRRSIWNYPFGLAMVGLYLVIFAQAGLYSDAALQVFFFVVQIYGWYVWYAARNDDGLITVEYMSTRSRCAWLAGMLAVAAAEGAYLAAYSGDVAPWLDAGTTVLSVAAQYLLATRKIETWILWIIADVIQIALYQWKGLYLTAALYVAFLLLSMAGLRAWRRSVDPQVTQAAT